MPDLEKVIKGLETCYGRPLKCENCTYRDVERNCQDVLCLDALALLKEQEKKRITLHKKYVITWGRNDQFSMKNLYEAICETLLEEGELFIARTDDHEKVDFVFYVADRR